MTTIARSLILITLIPNALAAQDMKLRGDRGGIISVGGRSSLSFFNGGAWNNTGTGTGGQFHVQLSERVNTSWYLDFLRGNIGDFAHRADTHIGWSVLWYLRSPTQGRRLIQPFLLAGHCFDHSHQQANADPAITADRWSSAVQAGVGTHFNLTDRFDISAVAQYMMHLGTDVHPAVEDGVVAFNKEKGADLEGHLLVHVGFNFKLFDAW